MKRTVEVPERWRFVELGDISEEIYYGLTAKASEKNSGVKILRTTDIKDYSVNFDNLPFCEITEKRNNLYKYFLRKGDLIVARAGTVGVSVLIEKDFSDTIFGSYLIKIRPNSEVISKFLHYFCQSNKYWLHLRGAQGSTLKNINLPLLKSLRILVPPLTEQKKIAEILSTVDRAIGKVDEAIEKTLRLKKGFMQELLTRGIGHSEFKKTKVGVVPKEWRIAELSQIGDIITGTTPSTSVKKFWGEGFPFITPSDFTGDKYVIKTERTVTKEGAEIGRIIPKDSVLVVCIASVGETAMSSEKSITNQQINSIVCNIRSNSHYLYYAMSFYKKRLKRWAGITTSPIIKKSFFRLFPLPLPPLPEQQKIAEILGTVDKRLEALKNRKEKLKKLKKGLMDDLLTGRVRVVPLIERQV